MKKFFLFVMLAVVSISAMAQWTVQGIPYNNPKMKNAMPKVLPMATTNDSFSFDDIQNWTGEGENQAAVVIQFNTGKETETNALVFGYRWNGTATGTDMIVAIAKEDPRFYVLANNGSYGYSIGGIGWDADEDGDIYLKNGDQTFTLTDGIYECASEYDYDNFTAGDADDLWSGGWFSGYWSYWVASDSPANFGYASTGASGRVLTNGCWDGWNFSANYGSYAWLPFASAPSLIPDDATTEFKKDGIYYTLGSYMQKTVLVSAPFEMKGTELSSYTGNITIPSTFTHEDVEYTVVGIADDAFVGAQIGKVELPETVTAIGKRAFQNSTLTSINITDVITKIGVEAFSGCSNLTEYKLPTSLKSIPDGLYKGTAITTVTFAETIESIGVSAFEHCVKIETLDVTTTLKAIGTSAFAGCDGLKNVKVNTIIPLAITEDVFGAVTYESATLTVPVGYTSVYAAATGWKNFKKVGEVEIPVAVGDSFFVGNVAYTITEYGETGNKVMVTYFPVESVSDNNIKAANLVGYVGDVIVPAKVSYQNIEFTVDGVTAQAFMGAEEMTSIKFNCVLTSIPERAMFSCKKLTSVEIPTTVTSIESKAFEQCQTLLNVTLPEGLLNLGSRAFYSCKMLENINLPLSLTSIGDYAFYDCDALKVIEFPESITAIPANVCYDCKVLAEVKFGSKVESIGGSAFQYCESLKTVDLPNTLKSLGNSVFASSGLESISIPSSLTTIPNRVFEKTPLKSVTMSDDVTSLGDYVFSSCASLESIKLSASLISLGKNAFASCTSLKSITIPNGVTSIGNYTFMYCI
ncbi:MAG: leucine-rich repeat domain-containing protein [Bacteroidales bacterium]|nr:leucine-rich repeat domain-containing protein [Bacteroidales bacterium]